MPKRIKKPTPAEDEQPAPEASPPSSDLPVPTTHEGKNPAAVALGKLGGKKGGPARAAKLTKEQRSAIAKKAAAARWKKKEA
jgi:hypothetical protein